MVSIQSAELTSETPTLHRAPQKNYTSHPTPSTSPVPYPRWTPHPWTPADPPTLNEFYPIDNEEKGM